MNHHFLRGDGEMTRLIRSRDWEHTPLGPMASWPQSLRTTVSICLASNFPINIVWGPEHTQIYNDGYRTLCGDKHPASLGMDYSQCWASAWPAIGQPFERALRGETSFIENERMFLFRNDYLEETFFTFSLSPIRDESGGIGGVFHPVTETTKTMLGERRTRAVRDLTAHLADALSTTDVFQKMTQTLSEFDFDLPFVLAYKLDESSQDYHLASCTGVAPGTCISPLVLSVNQPEPWPMQRLLRQAGAAEVAGLQLRLGQTPCGPYEEAPDVAFALPIWQPGMQAPVALLMAGASPRLPMNDAYRGLYDLIGAAFNAALARIKTAEEERRRLEMLAALDRAKTAFFSNVSHELRTPLTLMLGPLQEVLDAQNLLPAQRDSLQTAQRNAQRLLKLVNSLLDFSRIEAGRSDARFEATDLSAMTEELASNFRSACMKAGLALKVQCAPLGQKVYVDREMWEKIVLNLLSNAFKFTLQGSIWVLLRQQGRQVELTVQDTGVGIPAAEVAQVFERFHRIEGQRGRSIEGSGIGLSLVRDMVRLHGGTIGVNSTPGGGTAFKVSLPLGTEHLPSAQVHAESDETAPSQRAQAYAEEALRWLPAGIGPVERPHAPAHAADRPRILLVDDNADMRAYIQRILAQNGYDVQALENGMAALAAIRHAATPPELLLTDVMMPGLDGFALLKALRQDEASQGLIVILLSARAGEEARLEGLAAGADDYLVKPFSARELCARVGGAIALGRQRREAAMREQALRTELDAERSRAILRESQAHAASLFEQNGAGFAEVDSAGIISRVNARYCQILGRSHAQLVGRPLSELVHPEDRAQTTALFENTLKTGQPFEIDIRCLRPDGTAAWVSQTVNQVRSEGKPSAPSMLAVVLDISRRKQAEEEVRQASLRKDEFLAMLAHELRNPLAPISAAAQLVRMPGLDAAQLQSTSEVISRQVRHMTSLVDDLLDVSRVTRGLVTLHQSPQEVAAIVSNAVEQVQPLMQARGHHLQIDLAPDSGQVLGDQKRLVQILTNLLNNAAKFTPPGGCIRLCSKVHGHEVMLSVQDNGIGIAPELQTRVFDLFTQAERTSDRSQGGLGLGLALVKSLVGLHGGKVTCFSEGLGSGSVFTVTLARLPQKTSAADSQAGTSLLRSAKRKLRILVVDDNVDAAQMLALLLQASGHEVWMEYGSQPALARAREQAFDVCLLDIGLPGMNGNELARQLRRLPQTARAILIAVTGYGQENDRKTSLDAGFDHHLVKPLDTQKLIDLLNGLDGRKDS